MTPQQLLKETQRTAGDTNLIAWHNTLIEKGVNLKKSSKVSLHRSVLLHTINLRLAIEASGRTATYATARRKAENSGERYKTFSGEANNRKTGIEYISTILVLISWNSQLDRTSRAHPTIHGI
jgi:hypothetical protein